MMCTAQCIRDIRFKHLVAAFAAAFTAACISLANYHHNGSVANAAFLNAAHWVLVFLLFAVYFEADLYFKTDIELIYFVYGVLVGEVDSDSTLTLGLAALSMINYWMHVRKRRIEREEHVTSLETASLASADSANSADAPGTV